jgi:UDP-glucose 4-epimerase
MEKVLVTGGAGFLGSYLCEHLLKKKKSVIALDMADGSKIDHLIGKKNFQFIQGSVLDKDLMEREVAKADLVFHFAAIADPKRYIQEPLTVLEIDLQASLNIFKLAAMNKTKVVFASTSEIYGRNPNVPWKEDDDRVLGSTAINRWCYSTAKAAAEHYLYAYNQQEGLPFATVRFFNAYGPKLDDLGSGRVIPIFLKQFLTNEPITVHGDGSQTRTFVYVEDAAQAVIKVAFSKKAEGQAFNIGSQREYSMLELAQIMKKVGKFKSDIKFISHKKVFGKKYEDIPRRAPNVSKIKDVVNWKATTSLEDGLKKTIEYYRKKTGL